MLMCLKSCRPLVSKWDGHSSYTRQSIRTQAEIMRILTLFLPKTVGFIIFNTYTDNEVFTLSMACDHRSWMVHEMKHPSATLEIAQ